MENSTMFKVKNHRMRMQDILDYHANSNDEKDFKIEMTLKRLNDDGALRIFSFQYDSEKDRDDDLQELDNIFL